MIKVNVKPIKPLKSLICKMGYKSKDKNKDVKKNIK